MTVNLATYENGYYGYMNDHVRAALGELQEAGGVRAVVTTPSQLSSISEPKTKDLAVVLDEQQLYAYNSASASWVSVGASQSVLQQLIDGSFDGGVTTLLSTNTLVSGNGAAGTPDPLNTTAGWYFKNSADVTNAINWTYVANNNPAVTMTLANLTAQYAVVDVRAAGAPYFIVYTKPAGDGSDAALSYRSAKVYGPAGYDLTSYVGQTVFLHWGVDTGDFPTLPRVECTLDASASLGPQDDQEEVLVANLSTDYGYAAGYYEFVVSDLGYEFNTADVQYSLSAPTASDAPATLDEAFVRMDGVNDYISLSGTGSILDYTASWTVACEIVEMPSNTTDAKFMPFFRSGDNALTLRRGGTNWGFYAAAGYYSVGQANTWYAPSAGSKVLWRCDGNYISYFLDGVRRATVSINSYYPSLHTNDSIDFGRGGISFAQGPVVDFEGGVDNLLFTNDVLSDAQVAEWFAGGDVTTHSYYSSARDFVPCGEGVFPNVVGEKSNVTGSLVNGTSDDFVERT
tara:strand:- start:1051 stop:2592 length:1542 start_codon:yes stop_codon:yes gene_type:complete